MKRQATQILRGCSQFDREIINSPLPICPAIIKTLMDKLSERRLKENEVIFQQANKGVADYILEDTDTQNPVIDFYCECSNIACRERIPLTPDEYHRLHKTERYFIARKGHEMPDIESVVSKHGGFVVIKKFGDIPSVKDISKILPDTEARQ